MRQGTPRRRGDRPRVVVVGAGFGGLNVVQGLRHADVDVTLVDRQNYHLFQPLLYQVASGLLDPSDIAYPLRGVLRRLDNAEFRLADVTGVDLDRRLVRTDTGDLSYDRLVIATGSANNYFGNLGLEERAYGLKHLGEALALRARVLGAFEQASRTPDPTWRRILLTFVVVGAGPTGVEYAGALSELVHHVLRRDFPEVDTRVVDIVLVEATDAVLGGFHPRLGRSARRTLERKRVRLLLNHRVDKVNDGEVVFDDGSHLAAATIVWTAGVNAAPPPGIGGLVGQQRLPVTPLLTVPGHPEVYAIGDVAACAGKDGRPLPMLAPVAIQQGKHVARSIAAAVRGEAGPGAFRYFDKGTMATVGRNQAVTEIGPIHFAGFLGWLTWLFVHLLYLIGFRNRLLVMVGWAWNYLFYDRPVRLIAGATPPRRALTAPVTSSEGKRDAAAQAR